jgi:MraZ protein
MFDRNGRNALRKFVAGAESVTLDSGGRILIPRRYLEEANIKNDVRFIGIDNTIEIWNRQDAEAILDDPDALGDYLERMMSTPQENK